MENKYHNDDAINEGYLKSGKEAKITKYNLEFSRYKQDCRKRALDLAHSQIVAMNIRGEINEMYVQQEKFSEPILTPACVIEDKILIALADRYYNWLISIPE